MCSSLTPLFWRWPSPMTARTVMPLGPTALAKPRPAPALDLEVASVPTPEPLRSDRRTSPQSRSPTRASGATRPSRAPAQPLLGTLRGPSRCTAYIALAETLDCTCSLATGGSHAPQADLPVRGITACTVSPQLQAASRRRGTRGRCCARRGNEQAEPRMPPISGS